MMYWINSGYKCRVSDRGAHFFDRRPVLYNNIFWILFEYRCYPLFTINFDILVSIYIILSFYPIICVLAFFWWLRIGDTRCDPELAIAVQRCPLRSRAGKKGGGRGEREIEAFSDKIYQPSHGR